MCKKFSLIELLVVVAIIGILVSLLLPSIGRARSMSQQAVCSSNQKQIGIALMAYYGEFDERFPYGIPTPFEDLALAFPSTDSRSPQQCLNKFIDQTDVFICPSDPTPENYSWWSFQNNPDFAANGNKSSYMFNEWSAWFSVRYDRKVFRLYYLENPSEIFQSVDGKHVVSGPGGSMNAVNPLNTNKRLDWWHPNERVVSMFADGHVQTVNSYTA
ncbi:MAG: DUF1559 domain-containing protein, partial [Lentisphaeraceae bacterium]|nr:DUF1559 domain-containing protein [Lentisphaeraceae bacterium]